MGGIKREFTAAERQKVLDEYGTRTLVAIAKDIGVSPSYLSRRAREMGFCKYSTDHKQMCGEDPFELWPYKEGELAWMNKGKYDVPRGWKLLLDGDQGEGRQETGKSNGQGSLRDGDSKNRRG
ncbi:MAG: hypothetical protein WC340_10345 [Kiritimatiellia bacterium]